LLSGSIVAPSDMPDLALLRRSVWPGRRRQIGRANRHEGTDKRDFIHPGLALGQVNGIQYGIP